MARRRKSKQFFNYECTITSEEFKVTTEAPNPEELVSIAAFYELNPEMDDRPESIKQKLSETKTKPKTSKVWDDLVELSVKQKEAKEAKELAKQAHQGAVVHKT